MVAPPTSTTSRSLPITSAVTSAPRSTASGVGARTISPERRAAGQPLAADDVVEEGGPDRGPCASGTDLADLRDDVVRDPHRLAGAAQEGHHLVPRVDVARDDDGTAQRRPCQLSSVVQQHFRVAAVGTADEQDEVGKGPADGLDLTRVEPSRGDVHHLGAGAEADPVSRLGGHLPLVPDHRQPQPAARAGAGQRRRVARGAELLGQGMAAVEDVGPARGQRLGGATHLAVGADEDRLGERRADVEAEQVGPGHPGRPPVGMRRAKPS